MSSFPLGKWPVAGELITPLGTNTLEVATWMGPPLGSRAMWGGDLI